MNKLREHLAEGDGVAARALGRDLATAMMSIALAVVLISVTVIGGWSVMQINEASTAVEEHSDVVAAYRGVRQAVAEQAFAEAGFRRSPNASSRDRLDRSLDGLGVAVDEVFAIGTPQDRATGVYLLSLGERYLAEVAEATRDDSVRPVTFADDRVAGPTLDAIYELAGASIDARQAQLDEAIARQRDVVRWVIILLPTSIVLGSVILVLCWWLVRRHGRALADRANRSASEADRDALTGLANRRRFDRTLAAAMADPTRPVTLLLLDLDGFKQLNDRHGHQMGDRALETVARRFEDALRDSDLIARLGGDEFGLIAPGTPDVERLSARLRSLVCEPIRLDGEPNELDVSIGHAISLPGETPDELVARADAAMYEVKRSRHAERLQHLQRRSTLSVVR